MPGSSAVGFSTTVQRLKRSVYRRARGELGPDIAQTIGLNCSMTHSPGKIEYNCRYFLMTFRKRIRKNKFSKNDFYTLQGTMSHRPLTNTSSLKIAAAYCALQTWVGIKVPKCEIFDRSDFEDFYTIKSLWGAILGLK